MLSELEIKCWKELSEKIWPKQRDITDSLNGNINRMCTCDTSEELQRMYDFAILRFNELLKIEKERLRIKSSYKNKV